MDDRMEVETLLQVESLNSLGDLPVQKPPQKIGGEFQMVHNELRLVMSQRLELEREVEWALEQRNLRERDLERALDKVLEVILQSDREICADGVYRQLFPEGMTYYTQAPLQFQEERLEQLMDKLASLPYQPLSLLAAPLNKTWKEVQMARRLLERIRHQRNQTQGREIQVRMHWLYRHRYRDLQQEPELLAKI